MGTNHDTTNLTTLILCAALGLASAACTTDGNEPLPAMGDAGISDAAVVEVDADSPGAPDTGGPAPSGRCGDGLLAAAEICDDGNSDETDGCRSDCTFTCVTDADCSDADACNGDEVCDIATHTCGAGTAPVCDDDDACTADSCDSALGCVASLIDEDADGFASIGLGACGTDCDDGDSTIHPGAPETIGDGVDSDCNGGETCFIDGDGDGFRSAGDAVISSVDDDCSDPGEALRSAPATDCCDSDARANPSATAFQTSARTGCGGFDFNCSGGESRQLTSLATTCGGSGCTGAAGWFTSVPSCGTSAAFQTRCSRMFDPEIGAVLCLPDATTRTQACR